MIHMMTVSQHVTQCDMWPHLGDLAAVDMMKETTADLVTALSVRTAAERMFTHTPTPLKHILLTSGKIPVVLNYRSLLQSYVHL